MDVIEVVVVLVVAALLAAALLAPSSRGRVSLTLERRPRSPVDRIRLRAGVVYTGPAGYADEHRGRRIIPGPYALAADGKGLRTPLLRLVSVDDAPGDPDDGSCHYEVAAKNDPPVRAGNPVTLHVGTVGKATVSPQHLARAKADPEKMLIYLDSPECGLNDSAKAVLRAIADRELGKT